MIQTIENRTKLDLIKYNPEYSVICSVGKLPFHGFMDIEYKPADKLLEFMSFEDWLKSIGNDEMTIEDLAQLTFNKLTLALGDIPLCVTVHARTTVHAQVSATIQRM